MPDAEPQPPAGQQIELCSLLGQQHGLTLRADDDRGGSSSRGRRCAEERQQHQRLVARHVVGVDLLARSLTVGVGADDVVVG